MSFNEARALCAGSSGLRNFSVHSHSSFNEARALCAGSFPISHKLLVLLLRLQ